MGAHTDRHLERPVVATQCDLGESKSKVHCPSLRCSRAQKIEVEVCNITEQFATSLSLASSFAEEHCGRTAPNTALYQHTSIHAGDAIGLLLQCLSSNRGGNLRAGCAICRTAGFVIYWIAYM